MRKLVLLVMVALLLTITSAVLAQDDTVTLKFWHTYNEVGPETDTLNNVLIPMFEAAHPNIKIESDPYPYDGFRQALLTAAAGGTGPDVVRLDIIWSPEFADQGILLDLSKAMSDFQTFADNVFPGPLSTNAYKGDYYGLPLDTNTRVFIYNKTLYQQAGITAPPATIDDLKATCDKIKALGSGDWAFSDTGTSGWNLLPWIWSFGGDITNSTYTQATGYLNGERSVAALQFLHDMVANGCFSDGYLGSGIDNWGGYFGNTIASMLEGPWLFPVAQTQYPNFDVGESLMPAGDGGSISVVGGENIDVMASSQHQAEALEWLRFTQSEDFQLEMSKIGQLTVLNSLISNSYFTTHPYYPVYLQQLQTARSRTPVPQWTDMETALSDAGQAIIRGDVSAQDGLDQAAANIDALLQQNPTLEATAGS